MKRPEVVCSIIWFAGIFLFLQCTNAFHFYYIEQFQLFQYTKEYAGSFFYYPGGAVEYISDFFVQFYIYPYCGAVITSFFLSLSAYFTFGLFRQKGVPACFYPLALIPCIAILFCHFNFNYYLQGTISYFCCLISLYFVGNLNRKLVRIMVACITGLILLFVAGSISVLYVVSFVVMEYISKRPGRKSLFSLLVLVVVILASMICVYLSIAENYRMILLPDLYYQHKLKPEKLIYAPWIILVVLLSLIPVFNKINIKRQLVFSILISMQLCLISGMMYLGFNRFADRKSYAMKTLDYYSRTGQWDQIIQKYKSEKIQNYLCLNYLNLALAKKGKLAEAMFGFDQNGPEGLCVSWNKSDMIAALLSDIHFCCGDIASARQYAYDGYVLSRRGNGRLLKRLAETELIYGENAVAEKYSNMLKKTLYYRNWDQDEYLKSEIVRKKKYVIPEMQSQLTNYFNDELGKLVMTNPENKEAREYAGAVLLLNKDIQGFFDFSEMLRGKISMDPLPEPYQQALFVFLEQTPEKWEEYGISPTTIALYEKYASTLKQNHQNPNLKAIMQRQFGQTYWYYLQFK